MNLVLEILNALAAIATVAGLILQLAENYKRRRMDAEEKRKPGGHRAS